MGSFTVYSDAEYDVDIYDIISNIRSFSDAELNDLYDEISERLKNKREEKDDYVLRVDNLHDYYKLNELKKLFNKYSLEELEKLNK